MINNDKHYYIEIIITIAYYLQQVYIIIIMND